MSGNATNWKLVLLGETVTLEGEAGAWHPGAAAALALAYLALEGPTPRERLAGLLWPERPEARARANLRQLLLRIRSAAPIVDGDPLRLAPGVWVDANDLPADALPDRGARGLLAGVDATRWPALADWLAVRQNEHAARVRRALVDGIAFARDAGDLATAAGRAERLMRLDPWSEAACRSVMEVALARHEPSTALGAFRRLRRRLAREVGTEPGAETLALARAAARAAARLEAGSTAIGQESWRVGQRAETGGWLREGAELLQQLAEGLGDGPDLARALTELAWLEHRLGWDRRAQAHARRALAVAGPARAACPRDGDAPPADPSDSRIPCDPARADACFVLGSLAWADGDPVEARNHWNQALRALRQDDRAARLRLSLDLALVEDALDRPDAARRHYLAALPLARAIGEHVAEAKILNNLGTQLARDGRPSDGMALLKRAHAIARDRHHQLLEGYILDSIAEAHMTASAGAPASAEAARAARAAAARAADIGIGAGDVRLQIEAFLTLSRVSLAVGDGSGARRFAEAALARADDSGWGPLSAAARTQLARVTGDASPRDAGVTAGGTG